MEAITHSHLVQPMIVINGDDEMMDSDYMQADDDYDIDLAEAYSNTGDEEMKFDMVDDPAPYDHDDLMLDEADYQPATTSREAMMAEPHHLQDTPILDISHVPDDQNRVSQDESFHKSSQEAPEPPPPPKGEPHELSNDTFSFTHQGLDVHTEAVAFTADTQEKGEDVIQEQEPEQDPPADGSTIAPHESDPAKSQSQAEASNNPDEYEPTSTEAQTQETDTAQNNPEFPADEAMKIHPIIVQFQTNTLALFNTEHYINFSNRDSGSEEPYPEIPMIFLLSDVSLYSKGIDEIFSALREMLGPTIGDDAELTLELDALDLFLHEDNLLSKSISLSDLMDLHIRLSKQDGIELPQPLYIHLSYQARFTKRYSELLAAAGEGKGLSQVCPYSPTDEYAAANDEVQALAHTSEEDLRVTHESGRQEEDDTEHADISAAEHGSGDQFDSQGQTADQEVYQQPAFDSVERDSIGPVKLPHSPETSDGKTAAEGVGLKTEEQVPDEEEDDDELLPAEYGDDEHEDSGETINDSYDYRPAGDSGPTVDPHLSIEEITEQEASTTRTAEEFREPEAIEDEKEEESEEHKEDDMTPPSTEKVEVEVITEERSQFGDSEHTNVNDASSGGDLDGEYAEEIYSAHQAQVTVMENGGNAQTNVHFDDGFPTNHGSIAQPTTTQRDDAGFSSVTITDVQDIPTPSDLDSSHESATVTAGSAVEAEEGLGEEEFREFDSEEHPDRHQYTGAETAHENYHEAEYHTHAEADENDYLEVDWSKEDTSDIIPEEFYNAESDHEESEITTPDVQQHPHRLTASARPGSGTTNSGEAAYTHEEDFDDVEEYHEGQGYEQIEQFQEGDEYTEDEEYAGGEVYEDGEVYEEEEYQEVKEYETAEHTPEQRGSLGGKSPAGKRLREEDDDLDPQIIKRSRSH